MSRKIKDSFFGVLSHIINPLLTKLVRSRWLDVGLVVFLRVYGPRRNTQKNNLANMYGLLTKREVKMTGYWPSSFFACLWTERKSRSINTQKKNEANIQPS